MSSALNPGSGQDRRPRAALQRGGLAGNRITTATAIADHLRTDILGMRLTPGSPLVEKNLTAQFGVSRTPVREALIRLAEEGLVEIFPQSGTFVGRIPMDALPEAVVVRQALELAAVRFALQNADAQALDRLERIIERQSMMAKADDREGFHAADEAFHEAIAESARHPGLWRVAAKAKAQIDRCRRLTLPVPGRMAQVIKEHRAILAALRTRNEAAALATMTHHLSVVLPDTQEMRAEFPDYFI
ncbi:MAG: GntR family transcriptional regulator [Beijerinckiaceae bacterium]